MLSFISKSKLANMHNDISNLKLSKEKLKEKVIENANEIVYKIAIADINLLALLALTKR